jgi:cell wall-associated NlpC family hydrolase
MRHLLFVSVAVGMISATSLSIKAQTSVNSVKAGLQQKKAVQFIEGIEIKRDAQHASHTSTNQTDDIWALPAKEILPPVKQPEVIKEEEEIIEVVIEARPKLDNKVSSAAIERSTLLQFKYAQRMDVEVEEITNTKLYKAVDNWWATRYCYGGTTRRGVDCSALTSALLSEGFGITLPRTARAQYAECKKINRGNLKEGDLVFFNTRGGISHVGVYLNNSYFVHSSVHAGVTINSLNDSYYSKKFIGGGRMKPAE